MLEKGKTGQIIWKFGEKCTKIENILKKGRWFLAIITCNELLVKALWVRGLIHHKKDSLTIEILNTSFLIKLVFNVSIFSSLTSNRSFAPWKSYFFNISYSEC